MSTKIQNQSPETTQVKKGEIVDVDLEQLKFDGPGLITLLDHEGIYATIAIPSGWILLCPAVQNIADVAHAVVGDQIEVSGSLDREGRIVPCDNENHYLQIMGFIKDEVYGYKFSYRKGPDGYIAIEDSGEENSDIVAGVTLFNKEEYVIFKESTEPREGPTAIQIRIYRNDGNETALWWARENPLQSNIELALGEPQESVVGGVSAISYSADGLYQFDTNIIARGKYIYVLSGSYNQVESAMYEDFQQLVTSFMFTSVSVGMPQEKINPQMVCESALAYMTFTSSSDADLFVEACVRGEHPEVIDRYIQERDLDGRVI